MTITYLATKDDTHNARRTALIKACTSSISSIPVLSGTSAALWQSCVHREVGYLSRHAIFRGSF